MEDAGCLCVYVYVVYVYCLWCVFTVVRCLYVDSLFIVVLSICVAYMYSLCLLYHGLLFSCRVLEWLFIKGGCSRRGVQWMGVVLYNKTAYNIM